MIACENLEGTAMTIAIQRARAIGLALITAAMLLIIGALAPVLPKANASVSASQVLLYAIQSPGIPCNVMNGGGQFGQPGLIAQVHRQLSQAWNGKNTTVSYEEAAAVTGITILSYCPEYYGLAPTVDGVPYGPWVIIPTSSREQSLFIAYTKGREVCNVASSSGVAAAVQSLQQPDYRIPYFVTDGDARLGMLVSAASRCPWMMGAVRGYLGG